MFTEPVLERVCKEVKAFEKRRFPALREFELRRSPNLGGNADRFVRPLYLYKGLFCYWAPLLIKKEINKNEA